MILETTAEDYLALTTGAIPRGLRQAGSPIAELPILKMLEQVATTIRETFEPASWLIVEEGELVGMCSITRVPNNGAVDIGYGIAPTRQGRGIATRAIGAVTQWAAADDRISSVTAETAVDNIASQNVLKRNGFVLTGERIDEEDGMLLCWRFACPR
jgi:RimJ/RimL family protein N-acetyltransferase